MHRELNYLFAKVKTISPQNAFASVCGLVMKHNRRIIDDPKPLLDLESMSQVTSNSNIQLHNLVPGFGFLNEALVSHDSALDNSQLCEKKNSTKIEDDLKPLSIIEKNVSALLIISDSLSSSLTMTSEEILLCCPHLKAKYEPYKEDTAFDSRLHHFNCIIKEVPEFGKLNDAIFDGFCQLTKSQPEAHKYQDVYSLVDSLEIVTIIVSDNETMPVTSIIPYTISYQIPLILAKKNKQFFLTSSNAAAKTETNPSGLNNNSEVSSNDHHCNCGKGTKGKIPPCSEKRYCNCLKNKEGCIDCKCVNCNNPISQRRLPETCTCRTGCLGNHCPCKKQGKRCNFESG